MTPKEYLEENNNELKLKLEKNLLRDKVTKEMMDFAKEHHTQQLILSDVGKFYKCWNCKYFLIEQIESKENYAKYLCKKHKEDCNITYPKWQFCDDFEVNCDF